MNYGMEGAAKQAAIGIAGYARGELQMASRNTTVGENIDNRISQLREQIERLEEVKRKLNTGTILDVSLEDLSMAMGRY